MAKQGNALVVMAKAPVAGRVKTRLVPPLSPEEAAQFYGSLLLDLLESLSSFREADMFVAFTPVEAAIFFKETCPANFMCFPQSGGELGEKMELVFQDLFNRGYRKIVLIGSDLPVFPSRFLRNTFRELEKAGYNRIVLGPSRDGGYYLIGMNHPTPEIFRGIPWSARGVLSVTIQKLRDLGMKPYTLPPWFDIDTLEDLHHLAGLKSAPHSQQHACKFLEGLAAEKLRLCTVKEPKTKN